MVTIIDTGSDKEKLDKVLKFVEENELDAKTEYSLYHAYWKEEMTCAIEDDEDYNDLDQEAKDYMIQRSQKYIGNSDTLSELIQDILGCAKYDWDTKTKEVIKWKIEDVSELDTISA